METTPGVVIWRVRGAEHFIQCVFEELGEACFELRVLSGHDLLLAESFRDTAPLLARAEVLRTTYASPPARESTAAKSDRKPDSAKSRKRSRH